MNDQQRQQNIFFIVECAEKACILEVSSEKPGNVTPTKSFSDVSYKDFVLGARAMKPSVAEAAIRGYRVGVIGGGRVSLANVRVGYLIKDAVLRVKASHSGGNTHLGTIMLLVPLAAAAGLCLGRKWGYVRLHDALREVVGCSTVQDSLDLFDAVNSANAGGLGESDLDVRSAESKTTLLEGKMSFLRVMEYSSQRDMIAMEVAGGMPVVFETSERLKGLSETAGDLRTAIVQAYLTVLSEHADTLVARKAGWAEAEKISFKAKKVLERGGTLSPRGRKALSEFDEYLRSDGNKLNPGTTADIIAAALMVCLLRKDIV